MSSNTLGSLKGQFGIRDGQDLSATIDIINAVRESVSVSFSPYTKQLKGGGLQVNFQPSDFTNLLGLQSGHVIYEGGDLHWLSWLLKEGSRTIIVGYYTIQKLELVDQVWNYGEGGFLGTGSQVLYKIILSLEH